MLLEDEVDKIIKNSSIKVIDNSDGGFGKDLQKIAEEFNKDSNVHRFGNISKMILAQDALLGAVGDKPRDRYDFIRRFRFHYVVNTSAVKSGHAEQFREICGSLLAFRGALEWKQAGVNVMGMENEKNHGLLDKLKKG